MKVYINGKLLPEKNAKISVFDHGLLYGDGIFEGIRVYDGVVSLLEEHIDRLNRSAKAIALEMPMTKQAMIRAVVRTCRENHTSNGYVRLVITRGVGTLGLNPYLCSKPQVIIIAASIQLYPKKLYDHGLEIVTVGTIRNNPESINPAIKSLNYLNNILGKIEAINSGVMEALMLNIQGFVAEATGDNVFALIGNELVTPPASEGALVGITRNSVMRIAEECGYDVRERRMTRYDLYTADEVFLTGTAAEVIGVVKIDRRKIGNGRPGPVTRKLARRFRKYASTTGVPLLQGR
ncbi:MAG: branched-chain-amino-acid transaminase [Lentisphaerales bacterium]|jgi:branched-chain amino acid aminotransferase|nr:MAG: branched-chain-amino-acid transaminase [Lentisphaerales bacterium]